MDLYIERLRKCGYGASRAFCVVREVFLNLGYVGLENFVWSIEHVEEVQS